MAKLFNRVKVGTTTTGTGTVTLGAASSNAFCTFAEGGVSDGDTVAYCITEGNDFEIGTGVYTASGPTLTRASVTLSKISGTAGTSKMNLAGAATVFLTARKEDLLNAADPLTSAQVATQTDQETATNTTLAVTPGKQHFHPAHPKAIYTATVTPTAVSGAATSITTNNILWNTTHGLTSGDTIIPVTNAPTGTTNLSPYYAGVIDTTHFSLHLTLADALAGTNKVSISGGVGMTMRKLVHSNVFSYGMSSVSPVTGIAASTLLSVVANLSTAFSSAVAGCLLQVRNFVDAGAGTAKGDWGVGAPSTVATKIITYDNNSFGSAVAGIGVGNWSQQGTTAYQVSFAAWGDQ